MATGLALAAAWPLLHLATEGWPGAGPDAGPSTVDEVLGGGLGWLAVALTAWLAVSSGLVVLATLPGALGQAFTGLARALTPHVLRRALSLGLGATVGVVALPAPTATATATAAASDPSPVKATSSQVPALTVAATGTQAAEPAPAPGFVPYPPAAAAGTVLESPVPSRAGTVGIDAGAPMVDGDLPTPGWVPDRPPRAFAPDAARLLRPVLRLSSTTMETITVRRGDTLWSIAARHLGPTATEAEIAAEWPRWYAANRAAIGLEPDVILPGQQLVAPVGELAR